MGRRWVGGWVDRSAVGGCEFGCIFCFCFCFSVVVVLVFCYGGFGVRQWWGGMWGVDGWVGRPRHGV